MTEYWEKKALEGYWEAREKCAKMVNYSGDRRKKAFRSLEDAVRRFWWPRMDQLAKALGAPTFNVFFNQFKTQSK